MLFAIINIHIHFHFACWLLPKSSVDKLYPAAKIISITQLVNFNHKSFKTVILTLLVLTVSYITYNSLYMEFLLILFSLCNMNSLVLVKPKQLTPHVTRYQSCDILFLIHFHFSWYISPYTTTLRRDDLGNWAICINGDS